MVHMSLAFLQGGAGSRIGVRHAQRNSAVRGSPHGSLVPPRATRAPLPCHRSRRRELGITRIRPHRAAVFMGAPPASPWRIHHHGRPGATTSTRSHWVSTAPLARLSASAGNAVLAPSFPLPQGDSAWSREMSHGDWRSPGFGDGRHGPGGVRPSAAAGPRVRSQPNTAAIGPARGDHSRSSDR
jgi:hypothetical protein